jgi:hypothetical protein
MRGFALTRGNFIYVLESEGKNVTDNVAHKFVEAICNRLNMPDETRKLVYEDKKFIKDLKYRISRCTVDTRKAGKISFYHIEGDNYTENIPFEESSCIIFIGEEK